MIEETASTESPMAGIDHNHVLKTRFRQWSLKREAQRNELRDLWNKCDAIVHSWIMNYVSKHLLNEVVYGSNAHVVWKDLKERFNKGNCMRIFSYTRKLKQYIKELWNKYDRIVPVPSCGCDESKDYVEHLKEQRLLQFLAGLNDSYDHTRRQILLKIVFLSVNQAYEMIIEVESNKFIGANSADQPDPLLMSFGSGRGHNIKELSIGDNPIKVLFGEDNLIMEKSLS
ncbi:hypothetical protein H5410_040552 [Solanum commersonii]|uniref:Retrotransposon gag domain-containing protein n=1 Tax=Solanum commersonii TaxID=4109 RepID=A0A9J5XSV2_SOLCO|nr:hypothetical protein H5410_040552 [Solanum commersonii]